MSAEELGGAELHCATSGVTDHLAENEEHAISLARAALGNLHLAPPPSLPLPPLLASWEEPFHPASELRGAPPPPSRPSLLLGFPLLCAGNIVKLWEILVGPLVMAGPCTCTCTGQGPHL